MVRFLDSGPGEPAYNMAVDEVLLAGAAERPTLRLYAWDPPAVSLGCFQAFEPARVPAGAAVVRRITGGGAIRHRDELTFAIAAPIELLGGPGRGVKASFEAVNRAIARGLGALGVAVEVEQEFEHEHEYERDEKAFLCYERRSVTDLVVRGKKLVGSAQRRAGRSILQHGSIPLGGQSTSRQDVTVSGAAGRAVGYDEAAGAIARGFEDALGLRLEPGALDRTESEAAARLAREKYGAGWWTARR